MSAETAKSFIDVALSAALVLAAIAFVAGNCVLAFTLHRLVRFLLVQVVWANNFVSRQVSKSGNEYVARGETDQRAANQETRKEPFAGPEEPGGEWRGEPEEELLPLGEPLRGVPPVRPS